MLSAPRAVLAFVGGDTVDVPEWTKGSTELSLFVSEEVDLVSVSEFIKSVLCLSAPNFPLVRCA